MSFLDDMTERRKRRLAQDFGTLSAADLERLVSCARSPRDFAAALTERLDVAVIAEVKKASPSSGPIAPDCEASKQALHYENGGAAAISVLTEPDSFGGSFSDLSDVSDAVGVPVLCKDFVVDPVQLFLARGHGADAVLLMASVLGNQVPEYLDLAETLRLQALVEVRDAEELEVALNAKAPVVGVNSRDLKTLEVDPLKAGSIIAAADAAGVLVVAESGVRLRSDVEAAAEAGADAVLVGERLMHSRFPEDLLEQLTGVPLRHAQEMTA